MLCADGSTSSGSSNGTRTRFGERDSLRVRTNANRLKKEKKLA